MADPYRCRLLDRIISIAEFERTTRRRRIWQILVIGTGCAVSTRGHTMNTSDRPLQTDSVTIQGRTIQFRSGKYALHGLIGSDVPVHFLDTDLPKNSKCIRESPAFSTVKTSTRLCQQIGFRMGGVLST
jgi:hypothetical protein